MHPCWHVCSSRSVSTRLSRALALMVPTTPLAVMKPSRSAARRASHYPDSRERQTMERPALWCRSPKRYFPCYSSSWPENLEKNGLAIPGVLSLKTKMRCFKLLGERVIARFRPQNGGVTGTRCHPESLYSAGHASNCAYAINPPGVAVHALGYLRNKAVHSQTAAKSGISSSVSNR